jgi:uncharacterized cupin superfamily protein
MQQTVVPGIAMWSVWQPERNFYFNSFFIETPDGNLVVDPLLIAESDADRIAARGGVAWIALTTRDHERAARPLAARFGAKLATSPQDAPLLAGPVDRILSDGELAWGATVVALTGLKTPGEFALHFASRSAVVVGDALWGDPAGSVRLMPDEKLADPPRAALALRKLHALRPQHLLLGDGTCIFGDAHRALWACLEARSDVYVNRINVADAEWKRWDDEPAPYGGETFDADHVIGAEKLGFRFTRVAPGEATCPVHWHLAEEEMFFVIDGAVTLVGPRGEWELVRGDIVSFPTRANAAHKIVNRTSAPCTLLMVANTDDRDVCFYPNSHKLLVEKTGHLVRDRPSLDYYDGE